MNVRLYRFLSKIPGVGKIVDWNCNYFGRMCTFASDFYGTPEHEAIRDWMKEHPDKMVSPKKANEIIANMRKG